MGATHKGVAGTSFRIFPKDGIVGFGLCQNFIRDNKGFCRFGQKFFTELLCFRGDVFNVVEADSTVRRRCSAEVLQVVVYGFGQVRPQELVKTGDVGNFRADFHANS